MTVEKIEINKHISPDRWLEFFDQFSDGNRGRLVAIEVLDQELGDEKLIKEAPLFNLVYDPPSKGNHLILETGRESVSYAHTIDAPVDVWTGQDSSGVVLAIRILDSQGNQTIVQLKNE